MKFKDLTKDDVKYIKKVYKDKTLTWQERMTTLVNQYGVEERTLRRWASEKLGLSEKVELESEHYQLAKEKQHNEKKKRFLITAAQNATKINVNFWENLLAYAKHIKAEILVIPYRYHNPTSIMSDANKKQDWWDDKIVPYLTLNRHNLNNRISVLSDVKIQPTACMPLSGLESLTGEYSCIVGHPRVHMKSLPVLGSTPKIMLTTGNLTRPNFTSSKIGKISEFHMTYGAAIVEIANDETFFVRQITAQDNGNFNDLYWNVTNGNVSRNTEVAALIKGDIHYGGHDEKVLKRSFNELIPKLNPKELVLHDLCDFKSVNPHEEKDWVMQYRKNVTNQNSLKNEINLVLDFLESIKQHNIVVVYSNHNDFLDRFIINTTPQKNIKNALEYVEYAKVLLEDKAPSGLLGYIINQRFPKIKCLGRDSEHKVKGFNLSKHGSDGINGSRGNIQQFKRLNSKMIVGHAHSVARFDGAIQVGCNCLLKQGYNHSPSDWVHGDAIIHTSDGKCQHILYLGPNAEFTTFK